MANRPLSDITRWQRSPDSRGVASLDGNAKTLAKERQRPSVPRQGSQSPPELRHQLLSVPAPSAQGLNGDRIIRVSSPKARIFQTLASLRRLSC